MCSSPNRSDLRRCVVFMRRSVPAATWCLSLLPRPVGQPWLGWNRETTYVRHESPEAGVFESWLDVTRVDADLVSTRRTYVFAADRATLTSDSIRRYPPRAAIEDPLISAGYQLADVRDAPASNRSSSPTSPPRPDERPRRSRRIGVRHTPR